MRSFHDRYYAKLPFELHPEDVQGCCNRTSFSIQISLDPRQRSKECFASLAIDTAKSLDFSIIATDASVITNPLKVETFSSDTCERSGQLVPVDEAFCLFQWCGLRNVDDQVPFSIDLSTEILDLKVRAMELPKEDEIESNGAIGNSRRYFYYSNNDRSRLLVWILKDIVEWILRHCVATDDLWAHLKEGNEGIVDIRHLVERYRCSDCFKFYAFHPSCDEIFLVTPMVIMKYRFGNKCFDSSLLLLGRTILPCQNSILPFSRCFFMSLEQKSRLPVSDLSFFAQVA